MILLHENGYKALATTKVGGDLDIVMAELQGQIVQVGEGYSTATVGFSAIAMAKSVNLATKNATSTRMASRS